MDDKTEKKLRKIRRLEREIGYASPKRTAKLTGEIVRLKGRVFD